MLVALLAACTPPEPSSDKTSGGVEPDTDTVVDTDTDTETGLGSDTATDPGTGVVYCVSEQDVTSGILGAAWRSPTGTLFATGASPSPRVRSSDGVWTIDPVVPDVAWQYQLDGADDTEVWALSSTGAHRREADGSWTDMGAPAGLFELEGLRVFAPDDVLVVRIEDYTCGDCSTVSTPGLLWWDGATWTEQVLPDIEGSVYGMTVLPDRSVVLAADGGLRVVDPVPAPIATPPELYVQSVVSAPDGTLVAVGYGGVAIGTVAGGLALVDPGTSVYDWTHAWASSATDVWISGRWWELGVVPHAVIVHFDGSAWTTVVEDWPGETFQLAGGDGQVFAVGGYSHELVLVGDESELAIDREVWAPNYLKELAVDDVTGSAWSIGYGPALGVYEGGLWRGEPLPDLAIDADKLAVSDGRVVTTDIYDALYVYEAGSLTATPTPDVFYYWLAAADGVLFAAGEPSGGEKVAPGSIVLVQDAGAGWQPVDLSGLPAGAGLAAIWADGASDLWLGLEVGARGALAHWDGSAWTMAVEDLPTGPDWMRRLSDGQLYFTQFQGAGVGTESLWAFDGVTAAPVPDMPPDVRAAHLLPDGTWFTSVIAETATGDLDGRLLQKDPGGAWVEVFSADYGITMIGSGDTVWAEQDELSWTRAPCAP